MSDKMYLNLMQEQLLCEKIREYHILYDKSQKGYKEKVAVENAWKQVAEALDFMESGKYCFTSIS